MSSHFRRGKNKVYYKSDVWDPGSVGDTFASEEDLARTSFRSSHGESSDLENSLNSEEFR